MPASQPIKKFQKFFLSGMILVFLSIVVLVRFRLLGVPLERDEGEYAYVAQQLLQGVLPYTEAHSMKFPGIFFVYAGILGIFGQTPSAIHLSLLFVNLATAILLFFLGRKLLSESAGIAAGLSFLILTLSPTLQGFWANSEHFVLVPALGGILLMQVAKDRPTPFFLSGLLLGCALLIKQHAIFFFLFGTIYLVFRVVTESHPFKKPFLFLGLFVIGGMAPIFVSAIIYWATGNFSYLWFCTFQYATEYVSMISPGQGFDNFKFVFTQVLEPNFPILLLSLFGLALVSWNMRDRHEHIFLIGFFVFSFLAITPGFYFRKHYFILWMPALSLLAGAGFDILARRFSSARFKTVISVGVLTLALGLPVLIQKFFFSPFRLTKQPG